MREAVSKRRGCVDGAAADLSAWRREVLGHRLPDVLRARDLELRIQGEQLRREQYLRVRQLLEVLPLTIPALRNRPWSLHQQEGGAPIPCVAVAGMQLPDMYDRLPDSWEQAQEWATCLGYAALLVDLLSQYLGAPLMHTLAYQGSTSHLWVPRTYARRCEAGFTGRLPLFPPVPSPMQMNPGATPSSLAAAAASLASTDVGRPRRSAREQEYSSAIHMLQRSAAVVVGECYRHNAAMLPSDWSPFAWLAGLCGQISKADAGGGALGASGLSPGGTMEVPAGTPLDPRAVLEYGSYLEQDEGEGEEGAEGWDVVQPFLPPPPSQPDEVEHWARAMFQDNNNSAAAATGAAAPSGRLGTSGGAPSSASGPTRRALSRPPTGQWRPAALVGTISRGMAGAQQQLPEAAAAVHTMLAQPLRHLRRMYSSSSSNDTA